jgi:flagellar hook-basal body complex protein FliE
MATEMIASLSNITAPEPAQVATAVMGTRNDTGVAGASSSSTFGNIFSDGLKQVNQQLMTSQADLQGLALGNVENLHHVMIRLEESRISFQLMMQIRSRMLEAYQDVMKMQI